ncbi:hypothetical protein J4216_05045 [Candidatus Woesearchaeota archaeon]|nr:hypothetical protein [Candidatus Woesearchaeota archaeon]
MTSNLRLVHKSSQDGLNAESIVSLTYQRLLNRNYYTIIDFTSPLHPLLPSEKGVIVLVEDDTDWHKTSQAFMKYEGVALVVIDDKVWVVGNGFSYGDGLADKYGQDILAFQMEGIKPRSVFDGSLSDNKNLKSRLSDSLRFRRNFRSTFLYSEDGQLCFPLLSTYGMMMKELVAPRINGFVVDTSSDRKIIYDKNLSGILVESLEETLRYYS